MSVQTSLTKKTNFCQAARAELRLDNALLTLWEKARRHTFVLWLCLASISFAQAPSGSVAGSVVDESGAVIPNVALTITNPYTGLTRPTTSGADGAFAAGSLPPGDYEVRAEAPGFRVLIRKVAIEAGSTTTVVMTMRVGAVRDEVTVEAAAAPVDLEGYNVAGVVTRRQIESLPLNGRSFLQLAFLEPGVTVTTTGTTSQYNRQFNVSVQGGDPGQTRITVDGANIVDGIDGGTQQNFSQDMVQEFQISTANFDLSTGVSGTGAVNIVTRSGTNDFHGSGYFFYRDHNLAAYPGLSRQPNSPNPFFARQQPGFYAGGPIKKNRLWFFTNFEHLDQRGVVAVQPLAPFSQFGGIFPSPYNGNQVSVRFDYRVTANNNAFVRYSHDGNNSLGPRTQGALPSNWLQNINWADQSIGALTSAIRPNLVSEARFAYSYWHNRNLPPTTSDCPAPCTGLAGPQINVTGAGLTMGNNINAPQGRDLRHFLLSDFITWQKGKHRIRFGGEWEYEYGKGFWAQYDPAAIEVYSPAAVQAYNSHLPANASPVPLPSSFRTLQDVYSLPISTFSTGFGDPTQPPFFQSGQADHSHRFHFFAQDTWRISNRFTLNYGLGWTYESNLLNFDLTKPAILEPIFGPDGLGPSQHDPTEFSPALGFAWDVNQDHKTVIRGGAGIYYQTFLLTNRLPERTYLDPAGNGWPVVPSSMIPNPVPGVPGVPLGAALYFPNNPTAFTVGMLAPVLPGIRSQLQSLIGSPTNTDLSIRNVDVFKTADQLIPRYFPMPYSEHLSIGVQRQLSPDLVLDAEFIFKQFIHQDIGETDFNHFNSVSGPTIPICVGFQALVATAHCSDGPVNVQPPAGREHYKGLLLKLNKRFAHRTQFLLAYALQSGVGLNEYTDENNWFQGWGPRIAHHVLNASAVFDLPWGFQAAFISQITSKSPFTARISNLDLNGDGTNFDLLPGTTFGQFNSGGGKSQLIQAVNQFNQNSAGKLTPLGQPIPAIVLPANFNFGDNFTSQDMRLSRIFKWRERFQLTIFGEVFNLFNFANLSGFGNDLRQTAQFGQPTQRVDQVFGSGGPRAFQLGARFSF